MLAGMSSRHSGDSGGCPEDHRRVAVELMAAARALRVSIWSRTSEAICVAIAREGSSGSDVGRPPSLRGPMAYAAFRPVPRQSPRLPQPVPRSPLSYLPPVSSLLVTARPTTCERRIQRDLKATTWLTSGLPYGAPVRFPRSLSRRRPTASSASRWIDQTDGFSLPPPPATRPGPAASQYPRRAYSASLGALGHALPQRREIPDMSASSRSRRCTYTFPRSPTRSTSNATGLARRTYSLARVGPRATESNETTQSWQRDRDARPPG